VRPVWPPGPTRGPGIFATLNGRASHAELGSVRVEYLDAYGRWQMLENAIAARVKPGLYEITIAQLSATQRARAELSDGSLLRLDGVESSRIVGTRTEPDKVILTATSRVSQS
jgi:hypothetical protein